MTTINERKRIIREALGLDYAGPVLSYSRTLGILERIGMTHIMDGLRHPGPGIFWRDDIVQTLDRHGWAPAV